MKRTPALLLYSFAACIIVVAVYLHSGSPTPHRGAMLDMSALRSVAHPGEELLGGGTTVRDTGKNSFGRSPLNLTDFATRWPLFRRGKMIFERDWGKMRDGRIALGPDFSASSCQGCHKRDGRGQPPLQDREIAPALAIQFSTVDDGGERHPGIPGYGEQLTYFGRDGAAGEGRVDIAYEKIDDDFADGTGYELRSPIYRFAALAHGPLDARMRFSPRIAPANFGLGLLEAIPDSQILAHADPDDHDGDGISGRPNYAADLSSHVMRLGRFGWKANQPTIEQQVLRAFNSDMGVTSTIFPDDGTAHGAAAMGSSGVELNADDLAALLFYMKLLAVPKQRAWESASVMRGRAIFDAIGCARCHVTSFTTGDAPGFPELSRQHIHPYTDLLLHDMGPRLADDRPDGVASGSEWRTPPLWGIGLVESVNGHTRLMHDGRARGIEEAILWHGGEGAAAQSSYRRLSRPDRAELLAFLRSL
jgi:CxxC motif-containing protein (DUF1111 family)